MADDGTGTDKELRANWVAHDSIETADERRVMIAKMRRAALNTAMVEMPPIGDNHGDGEVEPFFDFIREAKEAGLVVFGWISNHKRTYPTPADLRLVAERRKQAEWVRLILNGFPCLDGIAIDYIRYPTWEVSDFDKNEGVSLTVKAIREVTDRFGVTLLTTTFPAATITYRGRVSIGGWEGDVPKWFRSWYNVSTDNYYQLEASSGGTGLVNEGNVQGSNPDYLLGPSFMSYQQDPVTWMGNFFVDNVVPMQYTADTAVMQNEIDLWETFTSWVGRPMSGVYLGLGWMDEPSSFPDSKFDPAAMVEHIKYGRSKGVGGSTIFRMGIPGIDDSPLIQALTIPNEDNAFNPPFATTAQSPFQIVGYQCDVMPVFPSSITSSSGGMTNMRSSGSVLFSAPFVVALILGGILLR